MEDFSKKDQQNDAEPSEPEDNLIEREAKEEDTKEVTTDPKELLISEIAVLKKTLNDLSDKKAAVKEDIKRLEGENEVRSTNSSFLSPDIQLWGSHSDLRKSQSRNIQVLNDYVRSLMEKSDIFGPTDF